MAAPRSLEIEEDLDYQRIEWRTARVTAVLLLAVMLATALGLFGDGPLSRARAGEEGGPLQVEYDRFCRFGAATRFVVHARADARGSATVAIDHALLERYRVMQVTPQPAATAVRGGAVEHRFDAEPSATIAVTVDVEPTARFQSRGAIRSGAASVEIAQFVYP